MKYYVTLQQGVAIPETDGKPADMTGFVEIVLPDGRYLSLRGKEYPAYKVALAVGAGQVALAEISPTTRE